MARVRLLPASLMMAFVFLLGACDNKTPAQHIADAQVALDEDDLSVASIELKNALRKDPRSGEAKSLLGQIRFAQGDYLLAERDLTSAIDLGTRDDLTTQTYLRTKNVLGKFSQVLGALEEKKDQLSPEYAVILGNAYLRGRDAHRAAEQCRRGLHLRLGLLCMARSAFVQNDPERAYKYVDRLLAETPDDKDGLLFKAEIEMARGNLDQAIEVFTHVQTIPAAALPAQIGLVKAYLSTGDLENARQFADRLVQTTKKFPLAIYMQAMVAYRQDDYTSAEDSLTNLRRLVADDLPSMQLMAAVKLKLGKVAEAERLLRQCISRDATNTTALTMLSTILMRKGEQDEVISLLQPVVSTHSNPHMWALLGEALTRTGELSSATEAYENASKLAPDQAQFKNRLAVGLLNTGDNEQAITQLDSALNLDGTQIESDYILIQIKAKQGDFAGAAAAARAMTEKQPNSPMGPHLSGTIALLQGNHEVAEKAFKKALTLQPDYFPSVNKLAQMALGNRDLEQARQLFTNLKALDDGNVRAELALVDIDIMSQEFDAALTRARQIVETNPGSLRGHLALARILVAMGRFDEADTTISQASEHVGESTDLLFIEADLSLRQGDFERASKVARILQADAHRYVNNAQFLSSLGILEQRTNQLTAARNNLQMAIKIDPKPPASVLLSLIKVELENLDHVEAQKHLDTLIEREIKTEAVALLQAEIHLVAKNNGTALAQFKAIADEGSRKAYIRHAALLLQFGQSDEAIQRLESWLQTHPDDAGMNNLLANARIQTGNYNAAKAKLEAMLPTRDPVTLNNLAWIYHTENNPKAVELARKAHDIAPTNPDIADTLGWILVAKGALNEAVRHLEASASQLPTNAAVHYHLGIAYQQLGDHERARRSLEKAVGLGAFDEIDQARKALDQISNI